MQSIVRTAVGVIELNYMWLPTWIGMNAGLKKSLETRLKAVIEGMEITPANLEYMHELVINELVAAHPAIEGLREYLDGLKYVKIDGPSKE